MTTARAPGRCGDLELGEDARPNGGMDDRLEVAQRGRVGEDDAPEGGTIERPVGAAQARSEPRVDGLDLGRAGREHVARDAVGIDDHDPRPLPEPAAPTSTCHTRSDR